MTTLTPEQLPNSNAQFIAYGNPTRVADPFGGDDAISVRPQVFVRYYRGIKIKELATPNEDTIHVVLDPESVGLSKGFGAYMNSDDPVVPYIREQFEAGNPVDIGLEYVRRQKAKDNKAEISPVAPIHALRGAENADGTGNNAQMMGASGNHIRAIVGLINGRRTTVTESDPREWKMLTGNRKGDLPPEGWKALRDTEDWTKIGAITPKGGVTPTENAGAQQAQQGNVQGLDMNVLSKVIGNEVRKGLKDYGEYLMRQEDATRGTPTAHGPNSSIEGKPWNVWVNKEQLNLGSYLVAGEGYALRWSFTYLGTLDDNVLTSDAEMRWEAARELADATQKIADRVQATAYNGEVRADRSSASFKEAVLWVRFHVETSYPFSAAEDFDYDAWFSKVGRAATASLKEAEASAHAFISDRYPKAQQETDKQPEAPAQDATEDRTPVIAAYLQLLTQKWTDRDGVLALAKEAKEKGLLGVKVWANPRDGQFSVEPFDGGQEIAIGYLTKNQYGLLSQAADAGQGREQAQEPSGQAPADTHAEEPPNEEPPTAPEEQAPAPQSAPTGQRTAQHIAADLARATTEDEIGASFGEARELNLLTVEISVQRGAGTFGITPVRPNSEGSETVTLGEVFNDLRAAIDAAQNGPQDTPAQEGAPAAPEAQDEPTEAQQEAPAPTAEPDETPETPETPEASEAQENTSDEATTPGSDDLATQIAQRAETATTPDEIKALIAEAQEQGVSSEVVAVRGGRGPLEKFLDSRLKRAARAGR